MRTTLEELPKELKKLNQRIKNAVNSGIRKTSRDAVGIIRPRVPKAFGELAESLHAADGDGEGVIAKTVVDAPHAAAVEVGTLPHYPDYEALLAWVKLRGMQGLTGGGRVRRHYGRSEGPTTPQHAVAVASEIKSYEVRGGRNAGRHIPVNAAEAVARRIANTIAKVGTHPHWYVRDSLPEIQSKLESNIERALDREAGK